MLRLYKPVPADLLGNFISKRRQRNSYRRIFQIHQLEQNLGAFDRVPGVAGVVAVHPSLSDIRQQRVIRRQRLLQRMRQRLLRQWQHLRSQRHPQQWLRQPRQRLRQKLRWILLMRKFLLEW